jgi:hypothetical protein
MDQLSGMTPTMSPFTTRTHTHTRGRSHTYARRRRACERCAAPPHGPHQEVAHDAHQLLGREPRHALLRHVLQQLREQGAERGARSLEAGDWIRVPDNRSG